jgi:ATP-dependent RNA helicase DDX3X
MADQLNMGGLSLADQQQPRSYIPPHMRSRVGGGPGPAGPPAAGPGAPPVGPPSAGAPAINGGLNNSAWAG